LQLEDELANKYGIKFQSLFCQKSLQLYLLTATQHMKARFSPYFVIEFCNAGHAKNARISLKIFRLAPCFIRNLCNKAHGVKNFSDWIKFQSLFYRKSLQLNLIGTLRKTQ